MPSDNKSEEIIKQKISEYGERISDTAAGAFFAYAKQFSDHKAKHGSDPDCGKVASEMLVKAFVEAITQGFGMGLRCGMDMGFEISSHVIDNALPNKDAAGI